MCNIFASLGLSQVVSEPTHHCPNGPDSMLDLLAMSSPSLLQSCETISPLSNSDHLGLLVSSQWKHSRPLLNRNARTVCMYNNANWEKANDLLAVTDWQLLITGDIDESWDNWQKRFLEVMQECIPQKTLPPRHNLPWLSKSLVQLMRKRNQLFSQAKRSKREVDLAKYRKMRNRVFSQLRSAKANYIKRINPHDAKQFWMMLQLAVIKRKLT